MWQKTSEHEGDKKSTEAERWAFKIIWWEDHGRDSSAEFLTFQEWGQSCKSRIIPQCMGGTVCAVLVMCHKKFYVLRHICPNMSAGAVIGYVGITVSDKLVNRKEVRSIGGVLISTCGFSSLLLETSRDKKHDGHKRKMEYCRHNGSVIVWMFRDTTDTTIS